MDKTKALIQKNGAFDYLMKVIIIGDSGVGKTNILLRFCQNRFVDNYYMTLGINYMYKIEEVEGVKIKIQIWDTAGQDKFKTITKSYYNGSNGVIIVYSVDCRLSFLAVKSWITDLRQKARNDCQIILIANKKDMSQRQVNKQQGQQLAKSLNIPFFQCSAKSGQNINQAFLSLLHNLKQNIIDTPMQLNTPFHNDSKIYLTSTTAASEFSPSTIDPKPKVKNCKC